MAKSCPVLQDGGQITVYETIEMGWWQSLDQQKQPQGLGAVFVPGTISHRIRTANAGEGKLAGFSVDTCSRVFDQIDELGMSA